MRLRKKETVVVGTGERIVMFSADGRRWFSDKLQAEQSDKARLQFLQESSKSLRKMSTFANPRPRSRR